MYRGSSSLGWGTVQVRRVWFILSHLSRCHPARADCSDRSPPGACGGSWRRHRWGPAALGSLFAGVLSPRLQPLPSAGLGARPDGEGGSGRTWKQKGRSGLCSLTQSWHRGRCHPCPRGNGRFCVPWSPAGAACAGRGHCSGAGHSLACPLSPTQGDKLTHQLPRAEASTPSLPKEAPTPPKAEAGALGVPKERPLPPLPTAPGTGALCPNVGAGAPGKQHSTVNQGQSGG